MNCSAHHVKSAYGANGMRLSAACLERTSRMRAKDVGDYGDSFEAPESGQAHRIIGYCENCGLPVYSGDEALCVKASGDTIHSACWDYYASEHISLFTESADTDREE